MEEVNNSTWKIESLRLTSFLKDDFNSSQLEGWLKKISKNEPLSINKSINQFQGIAQIGSSMLKLTWSANRIDLFLNSNAPAIENNIGLYQDINKLMDDILLKYFDIQDCPLSMRLAIGIILHIPIKNTEEGEKILQPKLKSVKNLKGTTDFLFRINRPIKSEVMPELILNRLMTWSIAHVQVIKIQLQPTPLNIGQQNTAENPHPELMCRLELDFNTAANNGVEMLAPQQKLIAKELLSKAMKVASDGEDVID